MLDQQVLEYIIDRAEIGVFVVDEKYCIQYWNQFMHMHSGKSGQELAGQEIFTQFPELSKGWFKKKVDSVLILKNQAFTHWKQRPYLLRFKHNRPVTGGVEHMYQNCSFMPLKNEAGKCDRVCVVIQDVTDEGLSQIQLQEVMNQLEHSSRLDGMTQLLNRSSVESELALEFKRCQRYQKPLSLIMFDLDHFKAVNDQHGHLAGDEVLRLTAECIRDTIRETDIAGRYGGEEFIVLATETSLDKAQVLAERLRTAIAAIEFEWQAVKVPITCSLGVAAIAGSQQHYEALISAADQALYQAKNAGRNCFRCFDLEAA